MKSLRHPLNELGDINIDLLLHFLIFLHSLFPDLFSSAGPARVENWKATPTNADVYLYFLDQAVE